MILNKYTNSSLLAVGAMCLFMNTSSSTANIPNINHDIYIQATTNTPKLIKLNQEKINLMNNFAYNENKKDDFMANTIKSTKVKSVNLSLNQSKPKSFDDLGYFEYNEVEHLEVVPRKIVKVKAKINSVKKSDFRLI